MHSLLWVSTTSSVAATMRHWDGLRRHRLVTVALHRPSISLEWCTMMVWVWQRTRLVGQVILQQILASLPYWQTANAHRVAVVDQNKLNYILVSIQCVCCLLFEVGMFCATRCISLQYLQDMLYSTWIRCPTKWVCTPQAKGFSYMLDVAQSKKKKDANIVASAQYNVGRAYFMVRIVELQSIACWDVYLSFVKGFGTAQSDSEAEKWWSLSADHGSDPGSIRAQNTLGLFYAREESLNLDKVWAKICLPLTMYECMTVLCCASSPTLGIELLQRTVTKSQWVRRNESMCSTWLYI